MNPETFTVILGGQGANRKEVKVVAYGHIGAAREYCKKYMPTHEVIPDGQWVQPDKYWPDGGYRFETFDQAAQMGCTLWVIQL